VTSAVEIRRAIPSDAALVVTLGRRCYKEHFRGIWTRDGLERYLDVQFEPGAVAVL
jgi:hypothetical protein